MIHVIDVGTRALMMLLLLCDKAIFVECSAKENYHFDIVAFSSYDLTRQKNCNLLCALVISSIKM